MKGRILIVLPSIVRGGAEESALLMASCFLGDGFDVYAAFPQRSETSSLTSDFSSLGVVFHNLDIVEKKRGVFRDIKAFISTIVLLVKIKPAVSLVFLPWPSYCFGSIVANAFLKIPTIVSFRLVPVSHLYFPKLKKIIYRYALRRSQKWISLSRINREIICESFGIPRDEVHLIYNGIDIDGLQLSLSNLDREEIKKELCKELNLPAESRILLTVGRLDPQKGYKDIVCAIPEIVSRHPDCYFVWVGEGALRHSLEKQCEDYGCLGRVRFLGQQGDVARYLLASDLFVFPTYFEGLPRALLEAMACGLPVVASSASSIPEIITDGQDGTLFETGNVSSLAKAVISVLDSPQEMAVTAANAMLRVQDFSIRDTYLETLKKIDELN